MSSLVVEEENRNRYENGYGGREYRPLLRDVVEARLELDKRGWKDGDWVRFLNAREEGEGREVWVLGWNGEEFWKRKWNRMEEKDVESGS